MHLEYFSILSISLIYIRKSKGPKTEPFGTPNDMCSISKIVTFSLTYCNLFDK